MIQNGGAPMAKQKRRLMNSGRRARDVDARGCDTLAQARELAKQFGITVSESRLAGRGVKDDCFHVQMRLRRFVVGEFWGTSGTLKVAGEKRFAADILEAVRIVGQAVEGAEVAARVTKVQK